MITLYHGSHLSIDAPLAKAGRKNLDFGVGVYVTKHRLQAEKWAMIIASRKGRMATPVVSVYSLDLAKAKAEGFRYKHFDEYNLEWLDYVVACRKGRVVWTEFDIVEGGIANDNVIDTVEDYEKGVITAEQALGQLQYKKVNHQICILNQQVIDRYLKFVEAIILDRKEETR